MPGLLSPTPHVRPFADWLLARDLPGLGADRRRATVGFVLRRMDDLPEPMQLGVLLIALAARLLLSVPRRDDPPGVRRPTAAAAGGRLRAPRPVARLRLRVGRLARHLAGRLEPGVTSHATTHGRCTTDARHDARDDARHRPRRRGADRRFRRGRSDDGGVARRGGRRRARRGGRAVDRAGRARPVLARADGGPVPLGRCHRGAGAPLDRVHRRPLRRRWHRDQQRPLPPPAARHPRPVAARVRDRRLRPGRAVRHRCRDRAGVERLHGARRPDRSGRRAPSGGRRARLGEQ